MKDGSRPSVDGNQVQSTNHHRVLRKKAVVLSAVGKGCKSSQVSSAELNASEPLTKHRDNQMQSKAGN
jgi:hypothetical protein